MQRGAGPSAATLLVVVAVATLAVWFWLEGATVGTGSAQAAPVADVQGLSPRTTVSALPAPVESTAATSLPIEEASAPADPPEVLPAADPERAEVPHVERSNSPNRKYVPAEFFEEEYADASLVELAAAKNELERRVSRLTLEAMDDFFARGDAHGEIVDPAPPGKFVFQEGQPIPPEERGLMRPTRTESLPNGQFLKKSGFLPWAEYTDLYDSQDEFFWLLGALKESLDDA